MADAPALGAGGATHESSSLSSDTTKNELSSSFCFRN